MLEFFFRHYDPWITEYHIYDNNSNDDTLKILNNHPKVRCYPFQVKNNSYVLSAKTFHDSVWKKSRQIADWVIITAIDEFLYHEKISNYLAECTKAGVTLLPALGFQMISKFFPPQGSNLVKTMTSGSSWRQMNKLSILDPNQIMETNFSVGRHTADPTGNIRYTERDEILNLHYKYLAFERTFRRHQELSKKLGRVDKENNFGHKYSFTEKQLRLDWDQFVDTSVENIFEWVKSDDYQKSTNIEKWWRKPGLFENNESK